MPVSDLFDLRFITPGNDRFETALVSEARYQLAGVAIRTVDQKRSGHLLTFEHFLYEDYLSYVVRVVIGDKHCFSQDRLAAAMGNFGEEIG